MNECACVSVTTIICIEAVCMSSKCSLGAKSLTLNVSHMLVEFLLRNFI